MYMLGQKREPTMRISDFDLQAVRVFVSVARHEGFARAQLELNMSQPAISLKIKALESRLGFRLCQRGRSGFALTDKGQVVFDKARKFLESTEDFGNEISELRSDLTGVLRVGFADCTITNRTYSPTRILSLFCTRAPSVYLKLSVCTTDELNRGMRDGSLQVAFGPLVGRSVDLQYDDIFWEDHTLYCGRGHPFFEKSGIDDDMLAQTRFVTRSYLEGEDASAFHNHNVAASVASMEAQAMLILTGRYIGYLPVHYARQWVWDGQMQAVDSGRYVSRSRFVVASRRTRETPKLVEAFLQSVKDAMPAIA